MFSPSYAGYKNPKSGFAGRWPQGKVCPVEDLVGMIALRPERFKDFIVNVVRYSDGHVSVELQPKDTCE